MRVRRRWSGWSLPTRLGLGLGAIGVLGGIGLTFAAWRWPSFWTTVGGATSPPTSQGATVPPLSLQPPPSAQAESPTTSPPSAAARDSTSGVGPVRLRHEAPKAVPRMPTLQSPSVVFLYRDHHIEINNMGNKEFQLWGTKLDSGPIAFDKATTVPIQPFNYHIDANPFEKEVSAKVGLNGELRPKFYIFISDSSGDKWTVTCELWTVIRDGEISVETRNLGTESGWGLLSRPEATPTFTQVLGDFVVIAAGRKYKPGLITLFGESNPSLSAYVDNGGFYVDAELYYAKDKPPLKLVRNRLIERPSEWDSNFDGSAIEVVDGNGRPRFQLIYHDPRTIFLRGIFQFDGRVVILEERNSRFAVGSTDLHMQTGPLFKYPSRLYQGQELAEGGKQPEAQDAILPAKVP